MGVFLVNLILTAFGYLLLPVIFAIRGKKYSKKKLKRIALLNCFIVWIIFSIIIIESGGTGAGASAILYYFIGHAIMKKNCLEEEIVAEEVVAEENQ